MVWGIFLIVAYKCCNSGLSDLMFGYVGLKKKIQNWSITNWANARVGLMNRILGNTRQFMMGRWGRNAEQLCAVPWITHTNTQEHTVAKKDEARRIVTVRNDVLNYSSLFYLKKQLQNDRTLLHENAMKNRGIEKEKRWEIRILVTVSQQKQIPSFEKTAWIKLMLRRKKIGEAVVAYLFLCSSRCGVLLSCFMLNLVSPMEKKVSIRL